MEPQGRRSMAEAPLNSEQTDRPPKWRPSVWDLLLAVGVIWVLVQQGPAWLNSVEMTGVRPKIMTAQGLDGQVVDVPQDDPKIYVFWATWCGPCHRQLASFKVLVESGEMSADKVVAISLDESKQDILDYQTREQLPFRVVWDSSGLVRKEFQIMMTPTMAMVDGSGQIIDYSSGLSLFTARWAKKVGAL